uniref:Uncharacterized protein n=1 Tax=Glossina brevipalpis TaxID=37001 RepID=A0A1A9X0U9_9MUSC
MFCDSDVGLVKESSSCTIRFEEARQTKFESQCLVFYCVEDAGVAFQTSDYHHNGKEDDNNDVDVDDESASQFQSSSQPADDDNNDNDGSNDDDDDNVVMEAAHEALMREEC